MYTNRTTKHCEAQVNFGSVHNIEQEFALLHGEKLSGNESGPNEKESFGGP